MTSFLQQLVLNLVFYSLLIPFSLLAVPVLALFIAVQAPFVGHRRAMRLFRRAIRWYGFVVIYILPYPLVRVRYENRSGAVLPNPCIVICNHRSSADPFLMGALPLEEAVQVVNTWPFRLPLWGPMARWAGYLGVNDMPVEAFFSRASALLRERVSSGWHRRPGFRFSPCVSSAANVCHRAGRWYCAQARLFCGVCPR